ncbi:MAG: NAD-dependent epimerase/dehydratase family protein [Bacteroidales bacterium]
MEKILIIGCSGQIGTELTLELRKIYGDANVFATDIKEAPPEVRDSGPFEILDVLDEKRLNHFAIRHKITQVYNLAAVLSGNAEKIPMQAWNINMIALLNILELGRSIRLNKVFWPSSIAVFGPSTPKINTPQLTITEPNTVYGISKLAGERWGEYYYKRYCIDFRSIRYPGLISYKTEPGGGTTDYAVEIYYKAIEEGKYECFLQENTGLPMMFMPDAIKATISLMEAEAHKITVRSSYNIGGMSFTPHDVAQSIIKHIPDFEVTYKPDFRQAIANSWPTSIDDEVARNDWGLTYEYDLDSMTEVMLREIRAKMNG